MSKRKKKKSWKERQRERQIKQQKAQEDYRIQREREAERKPRKWPKGKILMAVCLLVLIFGAYGAWQYTKPSAISEEPPPTSEAIYIRADGLVDPSTASILNVGNIYYTFTDDIHDSIVIERDHIVVDGANHTLQGTGAYNSIGIDLSERSNVTMANIKIKDFDYGVYLYQAYICVLSQNDLTNNYCGIYLEYSSNNTLSGNNITVNDYEGISLNWCFINSISGNNIINNQKGILLYESSNNAISGNSVTNNYYGIYLYDSSSDSVYHNNFVNNTQQVYDESWYGPEVPSSTNVWDDGYPSGGNYWSDYEEWLPDAEELGGSGIWNTPYVIDENNQDNYPLISELPPT